MRILAFSDLHCDLDQAGRLAAMAADADLVVGAGDFASIHQGLEETIDALSVIETPALLIPGNNETEDALRDSAAGWSAATVLHGQSLEVDGIRFFGLGGGIPVTPWDWSFDVEEAEAEAILSELPTEAVLVVHSPPKGHCDEAGSGLHLGSTAILKAIEERQPRLAVCGHIHESWGCTSIVGETEITNLGPAGRYFDLD